MERESAELDRLDLLSTQSITGRECGIFCFIRIYQLRIIRNIKADQDFFVRSRLLHQIKTSLSFQIKIKYD